MTECMACRECGALTTMQHFDEHHGLCTRCWHRPAVGGALSAHIDHDQAQAIGGDDDPIRSAVDRALIDFARDVGGDS